jgi:hypothetical protein
LTVVEPIGNDAPDVAEHVTACSGCAPLLATTEKDAVALVDAVPTEISAGHNNCGTLTGAGGVGDPGFDAPHATLKDRTSSEAARRHQVTSRLAPEVRVWPPDGGDS